MITQHRKNILENINLVEVQVVQISDYRDNSKDSLWAVIKGEMIDYTVDDTDGHVISGEKDETNSFQELWKFVRGTDRWVLDEIDQNVSIGDIKSMISNVEA